jgi:hypothetical protein
LFRFEVFNQKETVMFLLSLVMAAAGIGHPGFSARGFGLFRVSNGEVWIALDDYDATSEPYRVFNLRPADAAAIPADAYDGEIIIEGDKNAISVLLMETGDVLEISPDGSVGAAGEYAVTRMTDEVLFDQVMRISGADSYNIGMGWQTILIDYMTFDLMMNPNPLCANCLAGGPGSSHCLYGNGGLTVETTCNSGKYACCTPGHAVCCANMVGGGTSQGE